MNFGAISGRIKAKAKKKLITPHLIAGLLRSRNSVLQNVGIALDAHHTGQISEDEQRWIIKIEELRADLNESEELVSAPDYGAGSPDVVIVAKEMYQGKVITEVVGEACQNYSKSCAWASILFHLIRTLKPIVCIELGTCLGISAAYQGSALELNRLGKLVTLEGSPSFAAIAHRNLEALGLSNRVSIIVGRFQDTLDGVLDNLGRVDWAFIDGHHNEQATLRYFEIILPYLSDRAILVFDDIAWSPGMSRAWQHIRNDCRVDVSFDFTEMGLCLLGIGEKAHYKMVVI